MGSHDMTEASQCTDSWNGTWTGYTCCFPGGWDCEAGSADTCAGTWLPSGECCAKKVERRLSVCVAGSKSQCPGKWKGRRQACCMDGEWKCFHDTSLTEASECSGGWNGTWTGVECCMQGGWDCHEGGSESSCLGTWLPRDTSGECCIPREERRLRQS